MSLLRRLGQALLNSPLHPLYLRLTGQPDLVSEYRRYVAEQAAHLYVLQRTANYDIAGRNRPMDAEDGGKIKANYREIWQTTRETGFGFPYHVANRPALPVFFGGAITLQFFHSLVYPGLRIDPSFSCIAHIISVPSYL